MMTRRKTLAILFAILFLFYYQEWVLVLLLKFSSGISTFVSRSSSNFSNGIFTTPELSFSAVLSSSNVEIQPQGAKDSLSHANGGSAKKSSGQRNFPKKRNLIKELSEEIQSQLAQLQYTDKRQLSNLSLSSFCNRPKMKCGPPIDCELGCQIHRFVSCLLIAHNLNRTLIPDFKYWPKKVTKNEKSWISLFQPILGHSDILLKSQNSTVPNCPSPGVLSGAININSEVSVVTWSKKVELSTRDILEYPFLNGVLPVPYEIGMKLKRLSLANPFQWWVGCFVRFIMRLNPQLEQRLLKLKRRFLHLQKQNKVPIVGILIRRRDKLGEKKKTNNSLDKYMTLVKKYFSKYESLLGTSPNFTRRVYLATDDRGIVVLAKKQLVLYLAAGSLRYRLPKWDFLTFDDEEFSEMEELVRDIFLLRECDLVVCSYSSDLCRLVAELLETKSAGANSRVKSLDHKYFFDAPDFQGKNKFKIILQ